MPGSSTDLLRLQGGFLLSIDAANDFKLQMYATAELSFGVGDAQLTYGSTTALLVITTDGIAGSITVSSGGDIGLPDVGTLFRAKGRTR